MQINVSQLLKGSVGSTRSYEIDAAVDIMENGTVSKVQGKVTLTRLNRGLLVRATLHTELEVTCSRCLTSLSCPLTLNIEEEFFPTIDVFYGTPMPLPDESDCFTIDEHHILDLTEAVYQYVMMAIPMKPLCREDCAGICPGCGHNLNLEACGCQHQETDPRWDKLKKLVLAGHVEPNDKGGKE